MHKQGPNNSAPVHDTLTVQLRYISEGILRVFEISQVKGLEKALSS